MNGRKLFSQVLFWHFLIMSLISCSSEKKQNIILITLDTQRADHISSYETRNAFTPNIDSLAKEGILYENCYSPIPITLPAHSSIFYSQLPSQLKVYNNGEVFDGKEKISISEIFREKGYATGAFVSLGVLKSKFGLINGFDVYDDNFPKDIWYLTAEEINQKVFGWLETHKFNDFFLWIHYSDPHGPYSSPGEPPDLQIYLNDVFQKEFSLDKNRKEELDINLKKGKNVLRLEVINRFNKHPNSDFARLDIFNLVSFSDKENLKLELGEGATEKKHRDKINIYLRERSFLNIFSRKESTSIKIEFRGRLLLRPEGCQEMYRKEVEYMDDEIGKLITQLKISDLFANTSIVIVGDHGEGFGEYYLKDNAPHIGHIHFLYSLYLKVPYIIHSPHIKIKGKRYAGPVSILDVAPTILELMGWNPPGQMQGRNVLNFKKYGKTPADIFGETYEPQSFFTSFCLLRHPWHLIITPKENRIELYNLSKDPMERDNLHASNKSKPEILNMKTTLNNYIRMSLAQKLPDTEKDKDTLEMLRALGYIK